MVPTTKTRLIDSIENTPSDLTEEVEISKSSSPSSKTEFIKKGSTCTEETTHDNLVVSIITHSTPQQQQLVPPSSISRRIRTPPEKPHESGCASHYYDCYVTGVSFAHDDYSDADSIESDGYYPFSKNEYLESTWAEVVKESDSMHIPMLAIATTAIMVHPLIFVAGAGVAAASFWAVGAFSDVLSFDSSAQEDDEAVVPAIEMEKESEAEKEAPLQIPLIELQPSYSNQTDVTEETPLAAPAAVVPLIRHRSSEVTNSRDLLEKNFIPLENEIVAQVEFPGLLAAQFFEVFFSNDAPFTFKEFQKNRGDVDIVYGKWASPKKGPASLHQHAKGALLENMQERVLTFQTLTKSYFGPAYASATKTQRVTFGSKRLVILESRTRLEGIPFCDRFQVLERWVMETPQKRHKVSSLLTVTFEVQFLQSCSFESQIRKKSSGTVTEIVTSWCDMAKEALERTAKKAHVHYKHHDDEDDIDRHTNATEKPHVVQQPIELKKGESIEVQHSPLPRAVLEPKQSCSRSEPTSTPKRSRSRRGIGNSVRQRFSRKASNS